MADVVASEVAWRPSVELHKRPGEEWDVPIPEGYYVSEDIVDREVLNREIQYFDHTLSYEITGYRPITMDEGTDFDPTPFVEAGLKKSRDGEYTGLPFRSKAHVDWWKEQMERCRNGYTVGKYRVTGDHYFFLNFYVLLDPNVKKAGQGRKDTMPKFNAKQYEFFHYIELCEYLGKDVISFKARGVGFSEIMTALVVRGYTTTPNFFTIISAYTEALMRKTLSKAWKQLEYLNAETEGGMRRVRQMINRDDWKRASKVAKGSDKQEFGHMASIQGVTADKSNKLRGDRVDRLVFEEAGSDPILKEKYIQAEPLVEFGGVRIGTRYVIGTGGDSGPALAGLESMYLNPVPYKGLPYKHNYTESGEYVYSGFFIPAHTFSLNPLFVDHRGVTDEVKAKADYQKTRDAYLMAGDLEGLQKHKAESCFFAEEALIQQGKNKFNKILLAQQAADIKIHNRVKPPERGNLFWVYEGHGQGEVVGVKWVPNPNGKILIAEHPIRDAFGAVINNLYTAGTDSIDHGTEDSTVGDKGSKFCTVIKKRTLGMDSGDKYVALYMDRPKNAREAYTASTQLLWYFGAKTNLEDTKISYRAWLRDKKWDSRFLMRRPSYALNDNNRNKTLWGTPGTEKMIKHGENLIANYIDDFAHKIDFWIMIDQLMKFSFERKSEFDLVMAMVYCEIGDEDMYNQRVDTGARSAATWKDFGYYTDDQGRRRFGVKPNQNKNLPPMIAEINPRDPLIQTTTKIYNPYARTNSN